MIKFSIVIPTYNRPNLVNQAVESILIQSYQNFEILLLDNGSHPPLDHMQFSDPRIRFFRNENNIEPTEAIEGILNKMCGTHFLFLADDDALVPNALEIVKETFESNADIEYLGTGYIHYDHIRKVVPEDSVYIEKSSGNLESSDAWETMLYFFNGYWGIGEKKNYKGPKAAHSSGLFFKKDLIDKTQRAQKEFFIKSFGDVGCIGALLHIKKAFFLDLPLAIIGQSNFSDSMSIQLGKRMKLDPRYQKNLEYTPLKGISFINIGTDTHLRVIYRNKLENKIDCKLRPEFYFTHLQAIITDSPWTKQTIRDIYEVAPHLLRSLIQIRSVNGLINSCLSTIPIYKSIFWIINKKAGNFLGININNKARSEKLMDQLENLRFSNINDAGKWVDECCIQPIWQKKGK